MTKNYLWTASGARMQLMRNSEGKNFHWLFLPGGPGLGSEYLFPLLNILKLPGNMWRLDLPGDGSNTTAKNKKSFSLWPQAFVEATSALENIILVAHSRGGMFALATPEVEKHLKGLVLMATAPDMSWQEDFAAKCMAAPLPEAEEAEKIYQENPSNATLRDAIVKAAPRMFFTKEGLKKGIQFLKQLPFNYEAFEWSQEHFDSTYQAKWVPEKIPTLIFSGEKDMAMPIKYFAERKEYQRKNIFMKMIENGGHFPWIEDP